MTRLSHWMTIFLKYCIVPILALALLPSCKSDPVKPVFKSYNTRARVMSIAREGPYLWVGMLGGLIQYDTRTEKEHILYTPRQTGGGLVSDGVFSIEIGPRGNKWIGTYGGGLIQFDGTHWQSYTPFGHGSVIEYGDHWTAYQSGQGLGDLWVYDVAFDRKGRMWVATWKGVSLLEEGSFKTYSVMDGLVDQWVYAIAVDHDNSLWLGTEGGVTHFDGRRWKSYTHADGLGAEIQQSVLDSQYTHMPPHHSGATKQATMSNPNYVVAITIDSKGVKWFGTYGAGLSRFDGKSWRTYTTAEGLPGNFVFAVAADRKGHIWAGTNSGIGYFTGKKWNVYTRKDGLIDDFVYSILIDQDGSKWFGTRHGITRLIGE